MGMVIWKTVLIEDRTQGSIKAAMTRNYGEMIKLFKEYGGRHNGDGTMSNLLDRVHGGAPEAVTGSDLRSVSPCSLGYKK
jgi:hypothetical protein